MEILLTVIITIILMQFLAILCYNITHENDDIFFYFNTFSMLPFILLLKCLIITINKIKAKQYIICQFWINKEYVATRLIKKQLIPLFNQNNNTKYYIIVKDTPRTIIHEKHNLIKNTDYNFGGITKDFLNNYLKNT